MSIDDRVVLIVPFVWDREKEEGKKQQQLTEVTSQKGGEIAKLISDGDEGGAIRTIVFNPISLPTSSAVSAPAADTVMSDVISLLANASPSSTQLNAKHQRFSADNETLSTTLDRHTERIVNEQRHKRCQNEASAAGAGGGRGSVGANANTTCNATKKRANTCIESIIFDFSALETMQTTTATVKGTGNALPSAADDFYFIRIVSAVNYFLTGEYGATPRSNTTTSDTRNSSSHHPLRHLAVKQIFTVIFSKRVSQSAVLREYCVDRLGLATGLRGGGGEGGGGGGGGGEKSLTGNRTTKRNAMAEDDAAQWAVRPKSADSSLVKALGGGFNMLTDRWVVLKEQMGLITQQAAVSAAAAAVTAMMSSQVGGAAVDVECPACGKRFASGGGGVRGGSDNVHGGKGKNAAANSQLSKMSAEDLLWYHFPQFHVAAGREALPADHWWDAALASSSSGGQALIPTNRHNVVFCPCRSNEEVTTTANGNGGEDEDDNVVGVGVTCFGNSTAKKKGGEGNNTNRHRRVLLCEYHALSDENEKLRRRRKREEGASSCCPSANRNQINDFNNVIAFTNLREFSEHLFHDHAPTFLPPIPPSRPDVRLYSFALIVVRRPSDGKYLLVQERSRRGWWLPGGGVDAAENPITGAVRETAEEAGVKVDIKGIIAIKMQSSPIRSSSSSSSSSASHMMRTWFIFYAEPSTSQTSNGKENTDGADADVDDDDGIKNAPDNESCGACWVSFDQIKDHSSLSPSNAAQPPVSGGGRAPFLKLTMRGSEPLEYFGYVEEGSPIYPLSLLQVMS